MCPEALARLDSVFVHDAERLEVRVPRIVVVAERKGVIRVEPTVIEVTSLGSSANLKHFRSPLFNDMLIVDMSSM
jgi:hypothetical protein